MHLSYSHVSASKHNHIYMRGEGEREERPQGLGHGELREKRPVVMVTEYVLRHVV